MVRRTDDRTTVHLTGELRKMLAKVNTRHGGWNRFELSADFHRGFRLRIPHIQVAGAAIQEDNDTSVGTRRAGRVCLLRTEQLWQGEAEVRRRTGLDHLAAGDSWTRALLLCGHGTALWRECRQES